MNEYFVRSQIEPIDPPADRAQRLREMMERRWREPGVINARRVARLLMPISLGGDHGYWDKIGCDN